MNAGGFECSWSISAGVDPGCLPRYISVFWSFLGHFEDRPHFARICVDGLCKTLPSQNCCWVRPILFIFGSNFTQFFFWRHTPYGPLRSWKRICGYCVAKRVPFGSVLWSWELKSVEGYKWNGGWTPWSDSKVQYHAENTLVGLLSPLKHQFLGCFSTWNCRT